jgi:hypothetical protein
VVGGKFAELLGEQARAGAGHGRDAAQVENHELRTRFGCELARDVIDIGNDSVPVSSMTRTSW